MDVGSTLVGQELATRSEGKLMVDGMNLLGYDALVVGRQELRLGRETLLARAGEARFKLISANLLDAQTGKPLLAAYTVVERAGQRIAIVGLTGAEDLPQPPPPTLGLSIGDPIAAAREALKQLQGKAEAVVVLSRLGEETDRRLATEVTGIAAIVGTGLYAPSPGARVAQSSGTVLVCPGAMGEHLGVLDLKLDARGKPTAHSWQPLPLGKEIPDDPAMLELMARYGHQGAG